MFEGGRSTCWKTGLTVLSFNNMNGLSLIDQGSVINPLYNSGSNDTPFTISSSPDELLQRTFDNSFFYTLKYAFSYDDTDTCDSDFDYDVPIKRPVSFRIIKKSIIAPYEVLEEYTLRADDIESIGDTIKNIDNTEMPTICFSGDTTVQVEHKGTIAMKDLKLNDRVMVDYNSKKFEPVYSFGHHTTVEKRGSRIQMLKLQPLGLEISSTHMIFIKGEGFIPAMMVKIGDILSNNISVTDIQHVTTNTGVYAPFTASGKILVNGVLASNFVAFQNNNMLHGLSFHYLAYAFESTHRIWCYHTGPCRVETYNSNGISLWVEKPLQLMHTILGPKRTLNYNLLLQLCLILPFGVIIICFMSLIEAVFFIYLTTIIFFSVTLFILNLYISSLRRKKLVRGQS